MAFQIRTGTFWVIETRWNRFCLPGEDLDPDPLFSSIPDILELKAEEGWFLELPSFCPNGEPAWMGPFQTQWEATQAGVELGAPIPPDEQGNPALRQLRSMFRMSEAPPGPSAPSDPEEPGKAQPR
jgi:hypothetical protein